MIALPNLDALRHERTDIENGNFFWGIRSEARKGLVLGLVATALLVQVPIGLLCAGKCGGLVSELFPRGLKSSHLF